MKYIKLGLISFGILVCILYISIRPRKVLARPPGPIPTSNPIIIPSATPIPLSPTPTIIDPSTLSLPNLPQDNGLVGFQNFFAPQASPEASLLQPAIQPTLESDTPATDPTTPPSGLIRQPPVSRKLSKKNYRANEQVSITVDNVYTPDPSVHVTVTDSQGQESPLKVFNTYQNQSETFTIDPSWKFRPGRYTIKVYKNNIILMQQDFTWGVLAMNVNKSVYDPKETARISIGVLDETGDMVCDAAVSLTISDPDGGLTTLSTTNGLIKVNASICTSHDQTVEPDYAATYTTGSSGHYNMMLTATTKNGTYSITDGFGVDSTVPFIIERKSATRVYPFNSYPMTIDITARQDFHGQIEETVPQDFSVSKMANTIPFDSAVITLASSSAVATDLGKMISLHMPFDGDYPVLQGFGAQATLPNLRAIYQQYKLAGNDGIDFDVPQGKSVVAVDDGLVTSVGTDPLNGETIIIDHSWGRSYYGYLSSMKVKNGDVVKKDQTIGLSGNTGEQNRPELHFGMKLNNFEVENGYYGKIDPLPYLTANSAIISDVAVKKLTWNIDFKKGETKTIGYDYRVPLESPQFYLTGPLKFWSIDVPTSPPVLGDSTDATPSATPSINPTIEVTPSITPVPTVIPTILPTVLPTDAASPSATPEMTPTPVPTVLPTVTPDLTISSTPSATPTPTSVASYSAQAIAELSNIFSNQPTTNLVFQEGRQWQIAADVLSADGVTIATIGTTADMTKQPTGRKLLFDGTNWWAFYEKTGQNNLYYASSPDLLKWTENSVAVPTITTVIDGGWMDIIFDQPSSTVLVSYESTTASRSRYLRGIITGTTIAWSANTLVIDNVTIATTADATMTFTVDTNNKVLFANQDASGNPEIYRSTNVLSATFADSGISAGNWTAPAGGSTTTIQDYTQDTVMYGAPSAQYIMITDDGPNGGSAGHGLPATSNSLVWCRYNGVGGWTTGCSNASVNVIYSGAATSRTNWASDQFSTADVRIIGQDTAASLIFRKYDGNANTWTTLATPPWPASGIVTSGAKPNGPHSISLLSDPTGNLWYAFVVRADGNNTISYNVYDGAQWGNWIDITTTAGVRTQVDAAYAFARNQAAVLWTQTNGANFDMKVSAVVLPTLAEVMRHGKSFGSNKVLPYTW